MSKIFPKCGIGTKLRYKKIQKDMIFVPMPNRISIRHNKKADRCLRSAYKLHMDAIKKAGLHYCRSTHLGSGIAFVSKQQHRSPRRTYIYYLRYTHMRVRVYTYHRHLSVALFWILEFTRFR